MMPLLRRISFLGRREHGGGSFGTIVVYHSVSAFGSSTGTCTGISPMSIGFILADCVVYEVQVEVRRQAMLFLACERGDDFPSLPSPEFGSALWI